MTRTLDIIGALYDPGATEQAPPILLAGFHVNTTSAGMTAHLEPYRVEPSPLRRVWAGDDPANPKWTVPLRFDDEAEARTVLGDWDVPPGVE